MNNLPAKSILTPEVIDQLFEVREIAPGKLHLHVRADVSLSFDQLEIYTTEGDICIDTPSKKLYLNGRMGRKLFPLPESIQYRAEREEEQRRAAGAKNCSCPCPYCKSIIKALERHGIMVDNPS